MKINITAEFSGPEAISSFIAQLAATPNNLVVKDEEIKTEVLNKEGKWVSFPPEKIRFVYSK